MRRRPPTPPRRPMRACSGRTSRRTSSRTVRRRCRWTGRAACSRSSTRCSTSPATRSGPIRRSASPGGIRCSPCRRSRRTTSWSTAQGADPHGWNWGGLHAITLTHQTLGKSGIAPIEWLFNRGPYPVGGGSSLVDATGWQLGGSYATTTVPSMRMVVDLSDLDASTWNHLTGASGHAFNAHYTDQTENWSHGRAVAVAVLEEGRRRRHGRHAGAEARVLTARR